MLPQEWGRANSDLWRQAPAELCMASHTSWTDVQMLEPCVSAWCIGQNFPVEEFMLADLLFIAIVFVTGLKLSSA